MPAPDPSSYTAEMDAIFQQAVDSRLQCGWTTQQYLDAQGAIQPGVYCWLVAGSGRTTTVEAVAQHPIVPGVVIYRELAPVT